MQSLLAVAALSTAQPVLVMKFVIQFIVILTTAAAGRALYRLLLHVFGARVQGVRSGKKSVTTSHLDIF